MGVDEYLHSQKVLNGIDIRDAYGCSWKIH